MIAKRLAKKVAIARKGKSKKIKKNSNLTKAPIIEASRNNQIIQKNYID